MPGFRSPSLQKVCDLLGSEVQAEAGSVLKYRELKKGVIQHCPSGSRDLCGRLVDAIIEDEKRHNEDLKVLRRVIGCREDPWLRRVIGD